MTRLTTPAVRVAAALLLASAGAAEAQSCVGVTPDTTRCHFVLNASQTLNVMARAYLRRSGGAPRTDMRIEIDGRPCFEARERPGLLQGPPVGRCRVRLEASEHVVLAQVSAEDGSLRGVGVEVRPDDRLGDLPNVGERSSLFRLSPRRP